MVLYFQLSTLKRPPGISFQNISAQIFSTRVRVYDSFCHLATRIETRLISMSVKVFVQVGWDGAHFGYSTLASQVEDKFSEE